MLDLGQVEIPEDNEEPSEEKGDEQHGEEFVDATTQPQMWEVC